MAFSDPVALSIGTTNYNLARIATGGTDGKFVSDDGNVTLAIVPTVNRSGRKVNAVRLTVSKVTTDPLVSTTNQRVSQTVTVAFNNPAYGFTAAETINALKSIIAMLEANTDANFKKFLNQES